MQLLPVAWCDVAPLRLSAATLAALLVVGACSHAPPADFAPDPGLVAQIRDIRIITGYARACPGTTIPASYEAVLADGSRVPFSRSYDKDHPPRLHVVFLDRTSPEAWTQEGGDWVTERDPLATVSTGFRLTATLRAKPSATSTVVIPPYYGCMPHAFAFSGEAGGTGQQGGNAPDVTVRLAVLHSPFYDKLFVAGIEIGVAPPFYVLGDAVTLAPASWLAIESHGGRGGAGVSGTPGTDGSAGAAGCPAQPGAGRQRRQWGTRRYRRPRRSPERHRTGGRAIARGDRERPQSGWGRRRGWRGRGRGQRWEGRPGRDGWKSALPRRSGRRYRPGWQCRRRGR